jgi:hypothetical protein
MEIQIRTIYFILLTLLISISSCTIEKRLHFPGHTVRWNQPKKVNQSAEDIVLVSANDTTNSKSDIQIISTIKKIKSKQALNQQSGVRTIESKIDKIIEKGNFDKKIERYHSIKNKVSSSNILTKNRFIQSEKIRSKPDNDMWGFFGSILVSALVAMAIIIVVALLVIWILSTLPLATAKIIGGILLAILLLFFILY